MSDAGEKAVEDAFKASPLFRELERIFNEEDAAYFESEAKRQHFVPRLMLKRFAVEDGGKNFIYQLNTANGQPQQVQVDDAASRRYFYALNEENGERNNRIEGFLSTVEGYAAPALQKLLDEPASVDPGDRATLSFFFALLDPRTPGGHERMEKLNDSLMRMMFTNDFSDAAAAGFANTYRHLFGDESDENIEAFRKRTLEMLRNGEIGFADPKAAALQRGITTAGSIAAVIFQMSWQVLRRPASFVTSDRGLAMYDPTPKFPWSGQGWGSSPDAEVTIPLATDACLRLSFDVDDLVSIDTEQSMADEINLRTYGWAVGYIYGETQEIVSAVRRLSKQRPAKVVKPKPHHQMLVFEADPHDLSIAQANIRRGWPAYLRTGGKTHDYIVIGPDDDPVAATERVNAIVKQRATQPAGAQVAPNRAARRGQARRQGRRRR